MQEASFAPEEIPLFQSLTSGEINLLRERVHLRAFKPGVPLLEEGQDAPGLYVIRSGLLAAIVRDDAGRERELTRLGKGECVGEMALMTGEPCSATVCAITDTEAWFIERKDFVDLVDHCPGLWRNLGRILSQRLVRTSRHLAAQSLTNTVALTMACPEEEAGALAVAIAASLARQAGKRTLLVDGRGGSTRPASDFVPGKPAPSLWEVLHKRSLLREHEAAPDRANGLSGARVATLCDEGGRRPTEEESLTALEWLRPLYDYTLLLLPRPPADPWPILLDRVRSIVTIVAEEEVAGFLPWLDRLCRSSEAQGKAEVAIVAAGPPAASVKQAIEKRIGRPVRRIPKDSTRLQQMLREKVPLTETHPELPFSQGVDRLARHIGEMEVGLALSAGAAKGFAHIGVLRVLEDDAVPIDYIAGCSIGAIVGALYAGGISLEGIERRLQGADRKVIRWTLPLRAIWSDAGLKELLREPGPTLQFQELRIPFAAIATDLATGREVVLRDGLVWRAVQASVSIPGIFPPTVISDRYLVDGGLVNPVPTQTVRDMGADIVVAVDLMSLTAPAEVTEGSRGGSARVPRRRAPNLVEMVWRSNEIMQGEITARSAATADVTIQPTVGRSRWSDFSRRGRSFIAAGEEAARDALPELRRLLPFLAPSPGPGGTSQ
jgi:NTE family protein